VFLVGGTALIKCFQGDLAPDVAELLTSLGLTALAPGVSALLKGAFAGV